MTMNESFTDKLTSLISESFPKQQPDQINLLFLCRSGSRSFEAAMFMSDLGYNCYNITNGFEGKVNDLGHRGTINGWKAENLPWRQN
jgi:rhodanese-related sulfurtransferase